MINKSLFTSNSDMWETPKWLFDQLNQIYNFTLDVCATKENAKCSKYFTEEQNALLQNWGGNCYCNPPYGKEIIKWVEKAYLSSLSGALVVCLLPARTDTKWFHEYCTKGDIEFLKGRLKFSNNKNSAPFPSMIVVFKPKYEEKRRNVC